MYNEHFGLAQSPFKITPDTRLFYTGGKRGEILEALIYAITNGEGIVKVVGEVGSGKTMLCRMLEERLPDSVDVVYLANPSLEPDDILHAIAIEMDLPVERSANRLQVMHALQQRLLAKHAEGRQVVVFVEEAQSMPMGTLEEIRLLSNLETNRDKLLQIVLFGQPELDENLREASIRQLKERITHSFYLDPLSVDQIREYVNYRLRAVGYRGPDPFRRSAYQAMAQASEGLTRRVNILADKSLLAAYAEDQHDVARRHVHVAIADSQFETRRRFGIAEAAVALGALLIGGAGAWALIGDRPLPWSPAPRAALETPSPASAPALAAADPAPSAEPATSSAELAPAEPAASGAEPAPAEPATSRAEPAPAEPATSRTEPAPAQAAAADAPAPSPAAKPSHAAASRDSGGSLVLSDTLAQRASARRAGDGHEPTAADGVPVPAASAQAAAPAGGTARAEPEPTAPQEPAPAVGALAAAEPAVPMPAAGAGPGESEAPDPEPVAAAASVVEAPPAAGVEGPGEVAEAAATATLAAADAAVEAPPSRPEPGGAAPASEPPAPATGPEASDSASFESDTLLDARLGATRRWLERADGDHYSIQLLLTDASRRENLEDFLRRRERSGEIDDVYVYETLIRSSVWYGVLYRDYPTFSAAREALESLPPELSRYRPFIRNVRDVGSSG